MAEIKYTKTELRNQQFKLTQLQRYLPTLQLKKAMLQGEVAIATTQLQQLLQQFDAIEGQVDRFASLLSDRGASDLLLSVNVIEVHKTIENIAGVEIPHFQEVIFEPHIYPLFDSPVWMETAVYWAQELIIFREKIKLSREKKAALQKELTEVSMRVNLFEKILIPRVMGYIKRIKIFLGDQQLAAICQAKVAKKKIEKMGSVV